MLKKSEINRLKNAGGSSAGGSSTTHRRANAATMPKTCYFTFVFDPDEDKFFEDPMPARPRLDADGNPLRQPEYTFATRCQADGTIMQNKGVDGQLDDLVERFFTSWWSKRRTEVTAVVNAQTKQVTALKPGATRASSGSAVDLVDEAGSYDAAMDYFCENKIVFKWTKGSEFTTEDRFARDADGKSIPNATRKDWVPTIDIVPGVVAHYPEVVDEAAQAKARMIEAASAELSEAKAALDEAKANGVTGNELKNLEKAVKTAQQKVDTLA